MSKLVKTISTTFFVMFFIVTLRFSSIFANSSVEFHLLPSNNAPINSEEFSVDVFIEPSANVNISTFLLKLNFDSSKLKYTGIYSNYNTDNFKTYLNGDLLQIIYLTNENGIDIDQGSSTLLLELNFKVLSNATSGVSGISGSIEGLANYDAERLFVSTFEGTDISISQVPAADCNLSALSAEIYKLTPDFDPLITKYNVSVPSSKSSIDISATASDPEAAVKISRKTLNAAGKSTDIVVTVTGSDKKSKKAYTVTVLRSDEAYKASVSSGNSKAGSSSNASNSNKNSNSAVKLNGSAEDSPNPAGLTLVQGNFNFTLFFAVCLICVIIAIYIINKRAK